MSTGSNTIAAAFVPDVSSPNQEIAKTTLGIITVSSQSGTTSDDTKPDTTSNDKTPDTTSDDKSNDNSNETTNTNGLDFNSDSYTTGTVNSVSYRAYTNITYVANPVNESYQKMSIFIPEAYFSGGSINGYTASTAPIFMPNNVGGYMAGNISSPSGSNSAG